MPLRNGCEKRDMPEGERYPQISGQRRNINGNNGVSKKYKGVHLLF
jgi:hypothetical protein